MNINISQIWVFMMYLIGFVAVITIRLSLRKKLNHPSFNTNSEQKVRIIPTFKNMILVIFGFFFMGFLSLIPIELIFDTNQNIMAFICWMGIFFIFTCLNTISISDRHVHAKIKV